MDLRSTGTALHAASLSVDTVEIASGESSITTLEQLSRGLPNKVDSINRLVSLLQWDYLFLFGKVGMGLSGSGTLQTQDRQMQDHGSTLSVLYTKRPAAFRRSSFFLIS